VTPPTVPSPVPPDDPEAWYAPTVREQYEPASGVVATVYERGGDQAFRYELREPTVPRSERETLAELRAFFADASVQRPLTREATAERFAAGLPGKWHRAFDRLADASPTARRRLAYRVLVEERCLGDATPLALDDRVEVVDAEGDRPVVHTRDFAPAVTDIDADADRLVRVASERLTRYTVDFRGFEIPVVLYRRRTLGRDAFDVHYAVLEPDLLPGDRELIERCKERVWGAGTDGIVSDPAAYVRARAEELLGRELLANTTRAWLGATARRVREALADRGLAAPAVDDRYAPDRLDDLVYYVLRDFVGYGQLTVPIRDPNLEDIEANRVDERVKVLPRGDVYDGRVPTNLAFESETAFTDVVTRLAAADGTELNASNPSAKVNVDPDGDGGIDETIRCAVALPTISEGGPHISIRKQAGDPMTPADLVARDALPTELVALLWQLYETRGVVMFSGPTGVGKTTLMNAHMPFVPFDDRPVSIDEGSREVELPHETGVALSTREHADEYKRVSMADLMTEANYLNPDVEVIAEINTPASFATFAESLNTGHGVVGTTHAEDVETLVNRFVEQGLPAYLLRELDLVVFPRRVDGDRYVGEAVEFLSAGAYEALDREDGPRGVVEKNGTAVYWNRVCERSHDGSFAFAYDHPELGDANERLRTAAFDRLADRTDRPVDAVTRDFRRKHRYVEYVVREGIDDFEELFAFLADLRTDEAATVERVGHREGAYADD
jgi:type IV secretory pathway ATPase VirB11/archaellum biosynthesis ATPase